MALLIEVPDDVEQALRVPAPQMKRELKRELAFALYARWELPMGPAQRLAAMTKREFIQEMAARGIERHYMQEELEEDLNHARSGQQ